MLGHRARDLERAVAAVRAAALAVARLGDPASFAAAAVVEKGGRGPATVADLASQAVVVKALRAADGAHAAIVAEESAEDVDALGGGPLWDLVVRAVLGVDAGVTAAGVRGLLVTEAPTPARGRCWTIDPLDGTKGYLRGGQFAIALALLEDGVPVLGVLGLPRLEGEGDGSGAGVVVAAARGLGAMQAGMDGGPWTRVAARAWRPGAAIRLAGSVERAHSTTDSIEAALAALGPVSAVRVDSQAKYGLVARGDADLYVRSSPDRTYREWIWDHAAGALIAQEAGAMVTDLRGRPLSFAEGRRLESAEGVLCASTALHEAVLAGMAEVGR
jgi:3'-phosphoadenosine 5'-phosphosulfate (PAPS) 3'-phosphatase